MQRYRAAARFGPWKVGEEFESNDPHHETLADQGLLERLDDVYGEESPGDPDVPPSLTGVVQPSLDADTTTPEQPRLGLGRLSNFD